MYEHACWYARDYMVKDGWPVIAEDFKQWVIEGHFSDGMPGWDKVRGYLGPRIEQESSESRVCVRSGHMMNETSLRNRSDRVSG